MATETKQTWDEMKKMYPDQWLEIVDFETGKFDEIVRGVVVAHGSVSEFPPPPQDRGTIALRYTGESTLGDKRIPLGYPMNDMPSREIPALINRAQVPS